MAYTRDLRQKLAMEVIVHNSVTVGRKLSLFPMVNPMNFCPILYVNGYSYRR